MVQPVKEAFVVVSAAVVEDAAEVVVAVAHVGDVEVVVARMTRNGSL
jgi:hypothetical protein